MNEDVFPIEHGDFPASHVSELRGVECTFNWLKQSLANGPTWNITFWISFHVWYSPENERLVHLKKITPNCKGKSSKPHLPRYHPCTPLKSEIDTKNDVF